MKEGNRVQDMSNPDPNVQSTEIEREEMGKTQDTNINKHDETQERTKSCTMLRKGMMHQCSTAQNAAKSSRLTGRHQ
jgi:hypothetical protein